MAAFIPAPLMCQGVDEDLLLQIGEIVFPGFVRRDQRGNGLLLVDHGDYLDPARTAFAADQFQILLGMLRAWRHPAGQRQDEFQSGIGPGAIRDEHGNQAVSVAPALFHATSAGEIVEYARNARRALEHSEHLRNALWLNGRRDRSAADAYMIYEYAELEFAGRNALAEALGVSLNELDNLRRAANNLAPKDGGRHALRRAGAAWDLNETLRFTGRLLTRWIARRSQPEPPSGDPAG